MNEKPEYLKQAHDNPTIPMDGNSVTLEQVARVAYDFSVRVTLSAQARTAMLASRNYIESRIQKGDVMYGVNTGFGAFSSVRISDAQLEELQRNIIRSHAAGVGEPLNIWQTRAILFLRANALARSHSGVRPEVVDKILEFLNCNIIPVVPSQGSVGASGDLAPLSHLALSLIGEGFCWQLSEDKSELPRKVLTAQLLKKKNIAPLVLGAKEGLSLINGCQVMTAIGMLAAYQSQRMMKVADLAAAMTIEATRGSRSPYSPLIAKVRPHDGEGQTARNLLKLMGESSPISESHKDCGRVQDAYSMRCISAVHGAVKSTLRRTIETLEIEANSSTDNPLVFSDENQVLSCGNFHGEPVAFVLDFLAIAMSELGNISERRQAKLVDPDFSGLPAFLAPNGGLNSGHMIVQYASASLVSENKGLAHPASVDSIPTSADKEDHVSMGTIASRKLQRICDHVEQVLSHELLMSAQGLDLLAPLEPVAGVALGHALIREKISFAPTDRFFALDAEMMRNLISTPEFINKIEGSLGALEL